MPSEARARHITQQVCPESRKNQLPKGQFGQYAALDEPDLPLAPRLRPRCSSEPEGALHPGWP